MSNTTIRIGGRGRYCSGTLVTPGLQPAEDTRTHFALTCAHYFRDDGIGTAVSGANFQARIAAMEKIRFSDIAVIRLDRPSPPKLLRGVMTERTPWLAAATTEGFGGNRYQRQFRPGRVIGWTPLALSRELRTLVRPGVVVYNSPAAIPGDSGGPVIVNDRILALQSLILNPFGRNLRVATTSQLRPHLKAIHRVMAKMS